MFCQPTFGFECGLAAGTGGNDGLTIDGVGAVAGSKHALYVGAWCTVDGL